MKQFLLKIQQLAEEAGVFGPITVKDNQVQCEALGRASAAWYRVEVENDQWFVSLVMKDRWLSESIETDLLHYGEPIEELIEEELEDMGHTGRPLPVHHFRSDDMLYTFRSPLPLPEPAAENTDEIAARCLLAYEAAFHELGDMCADAS